METKELPRVFANRMIQQIIEHSFGDDMTVDPNDYMAIRTAFRNLGGSWEQISLGNHKTLELLKQVITAWGQDPKRQKNQPVLV